MAQKRFSGIYVVLIPFLVLWASHAYSEATTLYQSVQRAREHSPLLGAYQYKQQALSHDLKGARGDYLPDVDLVLGSGLGNHSDRTTRQSGADPSDSDWNSRNDASLKLTQQLYNGGETGKKVAAQKALLSSAHFEVQHAEQTVMLEAITAHLDVYMQRKLLELAERDHGFHQDILRALSEIQESGMGNIADVTQIEARLARAEAALIKSREALNKAVSNYERLMGIVPGELAFAEIPELMPNSLDEALEGVEQENPSLLAFDAKVREADARIGLANSTYKPRINLEMSSTYHDRLEGDPSWQNSNEAMLVLRWNLFNGGTDKHAVAAASLRKHESESYRQNRLKELLDVVAGAWASYVGLKEQKKVYWDGVDSSEKTFDAYMEQFSVGRRSLIDLLNAEEEFFQTARQLVVISVNEVVNAYRILMFRGRLRDSIVDIHPEDPLNVTRISQAIIFQVPNAPYPEEIQNIPVDVPETVEVVSIQSQTDIPLVEEGGDEPSYAAQEMNSSVEIGPFITKRRVSWAKSILSSRGYAFDETTGEGPVRFTRLREGIYPSEMAWTRLKEVQKVTEAFISPEGARLAIYVGSFVDADRALRHQRALKELGIVASFVTTDIVMPGTLLRVDHLDQHGVEVIAGQISEIGIAVRVIEPTMNSYEP